MPTSVAILGVAHVHAGSYAQLLGVQLAGVYDYDQARGAAFAAKHNAQYNPDLHALLTSVDAVIICSETARHPELVEAAAKTGKAILCEKPIGMSAAHGDQIASVVRETGVLFMTALPCSFAPAWARVLQRIQAGEIGAVVSVCATNHGRCPGGWFEVASEGGGAILDHVVHVANLLEAVFAESPTQASAAICPGGAVEHYAMITFDFSGGRFATIDSSWSRPSNYRTWGDVTLNIVGTEGVIEVDLFSQEIQVYCDAYRAAGFSSNLDQIMLNEFFAAIHQQRAPSITLEDGLKANRWAWAALESAAKGGEPVALASS